MAFPLMAVVGLLPTILRTIAPQSAAVISRIIGSYESGKINEQQMAQEIAKAVAGAEVEAARAGSQNIQAEIRADSWLTRNWRPVSALCFLFVIMFYALIMPVAVAWFGVPPVRVGDILLGWVMQGLFICLGGYVGLRSVEKIVDRVLRK